MKVLEEGGRGVAEGVKVDLGSLAGFAGRRATLLVFWKRL